MIFVRDKGRMCNNIVQYGQVYAWAREHGKKTVSMRFAYKYRYFRLCDMRFHHPVVYAIAKFFAQCKLMPIAGFHRLGEDTSRQEKLMLSRRWLVVEGWGACWNDLFLKYKQEIIGLFAFKEPIVAAANRQLTDVPSSDITLGLHIRRGDYRTFLGGRFYYTDEQYVSLIRQFVSLHLGKRVHVFICGNDPDLNKPFFREQLPEAVILFPEGNPAEDLCLLSRCNYLIGAPSSFSLVASMYRSIPIYWVYDATKSLSNSSFKDFDYYLQHGLYQPPMVPDDHHQAP